MLTAKPLSFLNDTAKTACKERGGLTAAGRKQADLDLCNNFDGRVYRAAASQMQPTLAEGVLPNGLAWTRRWDEMGVWEI